MDEENIDAIKGSSYLGLKMNDIKMQCWIFDIINQY